MKMKEVCSRTGLTERAVRLYLEKGLLCPQSEWRQGRTYHEFSEGDVAQLREISALRSVGFSLDDIGKMGKDGQKTGALLQKRLAELREEAAGNQKALELLEPLGNMAWHDSGELARALQKGSAAAPSLDAEPDFGRADGLTREEKQRLFQEARRNLARTSRRRKWLAAGFAILLAAGAAAGYWYWRETQPLAFSTVSWVGPAVFSDPMLVEDQNGDLQTAAYVTVDGWEGDFLGVFRGGDGAALFKGYFPGAEYTTVAYQVDMPRHDAKKLGLLKDGLLDVERVRQKVMSDDDFCLQYLSIREYQAVPYGPEHQK